MQDKMHEIAEGILGVIEQLPRVEGLDRTIQHLRELHAALEDLTVECDEMIKCELTITKTDGLDYTRIISTYLPTSFVRLVLSAKDKAPRSRTSREEAALTLLPLFVESILEIELVVVPRITARHIQVQPLAPDA